MVNSWGPIKDIQLESNETKECVFNGTQVSYILDNLSI